MDAKTNGQQPAHPCGQKWREVDLVGNESRHSRGPLHQGTSKREEFAKAFLAGLLANPGGPVQASQSCGWQSTTNCTREIVAMEAVAYADALLAALQEPRS